MEFIAKAHKGLKGACIFCALPKKRPSPKNLVLYRGKTACVLLNKYPYSNGHLLVVPLRHVADLKDLTPNEHLELAELNVRCIAALKKVCKAQGFNVGLNLGAVAGAGIKDHLHYHVVPRWNGDSNFMAAVGDVRMMPDHIEATYRKLAKHF